MSGKSDVEALGSAIGIHKAGNRLCVGIRVSPSAPRTELRGVFGERLKLAVNAPPEDNRANKEVEAALAEWLGVRRDQVKVCKGHASRDKVVAFAGLTEETLRRAIAAAIAGRRMVGDDGLVG